MDTPLSRSVFCFFSSRKENVPLSRKENVPPSRKKTYPFRRKEIVPLLRRKGIVPPAAAQTPLVPCRYFQYNTGMKWYEITVYTTDAGAEPVCGALTSAGLSGFSIEESREKAAAFLNESALYWDFADMDKIGTDTPCVKAYLAVLPENAPVLEEAKAAIARLKTLDLGFDLGTLALTISVRDEEDWANNWKQYYKPLAIGERLLVLPSWENEPEGNTRTVLRLDPDMAFGTGAHHTTRMCLEYLEQVVQTGQEVLDLGCGSGILSIASLLLGAEDAVAVDIDPIAERIARENADMNGLGNAHYHIKIGDVLTDARLQRLIAGQYDVVVANIVADVIIRLAPLAKGYCKPGAPFIVSGIIDERRDEVLAALRVAGFTVEDMKNAEGWNAILSRA